MKLVHKILKEATFENDQATVDLAKKYISKIEEYLNKYNGANNNVVEFHGDQGYIIVHVGELKIYLMDSRYYRGSSGGYRDNLIAIHNSKFKFDKETGKLNYEFNKSTLLHELVHYLDDKRATPGDMAKTGEQQAKKSGIADKAYFNNPYEFNAHFLQLVFGKLPELIKEPNGIPKEFNEFRQEIFRGNNRLQTFYESLDEKLKKNFLKRLYNVFTVTKKGELQVNKQIQDSNLENAPEYAEKKKDNLVKSLYKYLKNFFSNTEAA